MKITNEELNDLINRIDKLAQADTGKVVGVQIQALRNWVTHIVEENLPPADDYKKKLGYHCDVPPSASDVAEMIAAKIPAVLINAARDWGQATTAIKQLRAAGIRVMVRDIRYEYFWQFGAPGANVWFDAMTQYIQLFTAQELTDMYWMGMNEWGDDSPNAAVRRERAPIYVEYEIARSNKLKSVGTHSCAFNFSSGTPGLKAFGDPEELSLYDEAFRVLEKNEDRLGVHEYYGPERFILEQPWVAGRINVAWDEHIKAVAPNLLTVITEYGFGLLGQGKGYKGVKSESEYANDLILSDANLYQYPYIDSVLIYLLNYGNAEWESFAVAGEVFNKINKYMGE